MFTSQVGRLLNSAIDPEVSRTLTELLGNCAQSLEHRGDVNVNVDGFPNGNVLPEFPFTEGDTYAALNIQNKNSDIIDPVAKPVVRNGWAGMFRGAVNILPNRRLGIGLVVNGGVWADKVYANGYYDQNGDKFVAVSVRWAVAQSNSTTGSPDSVTCKFCTDASGVGVGGDNINVILPERSGVNHKVSTGDVIAVAIASDDTYVCVSDYSDLSGVPIIRFALTATLTPGATANATNVSTSGSIVVDDYSSPGRWRGISGYQGLARYNASTTRYDIIWMEQIAEYVTVTLTERMGQNVADVSQNATVSGYWNGVDPGSTVHVYDVPGDLYANLQNGAKIICRYDWTNGRYVPSGFDARIFYVQAQHNWNTSLYFAAKFWNPSTGLAEGSEFNVDLAKATVAGANTRDPNVVKGMVLACSVDQYGTPFCIDPSAWDDPIGTIKAWWKAYNSDEGNIGGQITGTYISGWARMDGTINGTSVGGSGIDMKGYFPLGKTGSATTAPDNTAGGSTSHGHDLSIDGTVVDVTVDDHPDHTHPMGEYGLTLRYNPDTPYRGTSWTDGALVPWDDDHPTDGFGNSPAYTGPPTEYSVSHSSNHGYVTLDHAVTVDSHGHTGTADDASHIPPYKAIHFIERVNNSYNLIGI